MGGELFDVGTINSSPAFTAATLAWPCALGGIVGSFLNVVVHRLPRHESLLYPALRCPACKTPIRWYDNVPVFGWLMLRGRCRDCGVAISARYPLVEAATALIFLLLGWLELLHGGMELPWGVYAYHLLLLCALLCAALIEHDGHAVPWRLVLVALAIGLAMPVAWPGLRQMASEIALPEQIAAQPALSALAQGIASAAVGAVLGLLMWPAAGLGPAGHAGRASALAALIFVGICLGYQNAVGICLVASALYLILSVTARAWPALQRVGFCMFALICTLGWIVVWSALGQWSPKLNPTRTDVESLVYVAVIGVFSVATYVRRSGLRQPISNATAPQSAVR